MGPNDSAQVLQRVCHLSWTWFKCYSSTWTPTALISNTFLRVVVVISVFWDSTAQMASSSTKQPSRIKKKIYMNCWEIKRVWKQTGYLHLNSETLKLMRHFLVKEVFFLYVLLFHWRMIYICVHSVLTYRLYQAEFHLQPGRFPCNP